jgi:hypothetical protein
MKTAFKFRFIAGFTATFALFCSLFISSCQKDDSLISSELRTENEFSQVTDRTALPVYIFRWYLHRDTLPAALHLPMTRQPACMNCC